MTFKDLREVWGMGAAGGMANVTVYSNNKKILALEDFLIDIVEKYPWVDSCEVKMIAPDRYIYSPGHSSCLIILDSK